MTYGLYKKSIIDKLQFCKISSLRDAIHLLVGIFSHCFSTFMGVYNFLNKIANTNNRVSRDIPQ